MPTTTSLGSAVIPDNLGSGQAHLSGFGKGGGILAYMRSIVFDLRAIETAYNAHTHAAAVDSPDSVTATEGVVLGTTFSDE